MNSITVYTDGGDIVESAEKGMKVQWNLPSATTQNAKTFWSLTGSGHLQESNHRAPLPRRGSRTSAFIYGR